MSKPVSRGKPFVAPPRPVTILRRPRSFMSTAATPADRVHVDVELVAVHHVRVDERGEQVVRSRDRVQVAGEVEVQVLHRHDLRVAGAGSAALDAEDRAERGLAAGTAATDSPIAPKPCVSETDVVVLPSPALVGVTAVTQMILPSGRSAEPIEHAQVDLGLVLAVLLDLVVQQACLGRDLGDRPKDGFLGDLETALQRPTPV